jgi:hypothetical protein
MITDHIGKATLQRYIAAREQIDRDLDFINVFTAILSQYKECGGDELLVDLYAIGYVNEMLRTKALDVIDALDDFILLGEAMGAVIEEDGSG